MSWSLSLHRMWSIIWEEYMLDAHVLFSVGFCPQVLTALSALNIDFYLFSTVSLLFSFWVLFLCTIIWKMFSEKKARINSPFLISLWNHSPSYSACIDCATMASNIFLHILCRFSHCIWQENLSRRIWQENSIMVGLVSLFSGLSEEV